MPLRASHRAIIAMMAAVIPSLVSTTSESQAIAPAIGRDAPARRVWFDLGWDPTWITGIGGSHVVWRPRSGTRVDLDIGARVPIVLGFDAWQLATGATVLLVAEEGIGVAIGVHPDLRLAHDLSRLALGSIAPKGRHDVCTGGHHASIGTVRWHRVDFLVAPFRCLGVGVLRFRH